MSARHLSRPVGPSRPTFLLAIVLAASALTCSAGLAATKEDLSNARCMECHGNPEKSKTLIDLTKFERSVHADTDCVECHDTIRKAKHKEKLPKVNCTSCHEEEAQRFKQSVHATPARATSDYALTCTDCHGTHDMLNKKDPASPINPRNVADTCGNCHAKHEVMAIFARRGVDPLASYRHGPHGKAWDEPRKVGKSGQKISRPASCVDCHGEHLVVPRLHPQSKISKVAIPKTCGKCHKDEAADFTLSVHWQSVAVRGNYEPPVCNDCHAEHNVASAPTAAIVDRKLAATRLCADCHANPVLVSRFGLDAERFSSYMKTYHGLAVLRGAPDAASCVSCHEVHAIRSKKDPHSTVSADNLEKTCGTCHQMANADFVQVAAHPINQSERNPVAYYVRIAYLWLMALTLGAMVLHNFVIMWYYFIDRWRAKRQARLYRRFSRYNIIQHLLLIISFTALAFSGFALKFPDSFMGEALVWVGISESARRWIHRAAAVLMVAIALVHVCYFRFARGGRIDVSALLPRFKDFRDLLQNMRFHLHLTKERPTFGRFDYCEKAEYLGLIWGVGLMTLTGFILWFPEVALQYLPVWAFEVSEVVHYFEALLAVAVIFIWHLFFVIYHPESYPMNTTWIDGLSPKGHGEPPDEAPAPTGEENDKREP